MTRVGLLLLASFFAVIYIGWVLVTPPLGSSAEIFTAATARVVVTFFEATPIFVLADRKLSEWRWSRAVVGLLLSVCVLVIVSVAFGGVPIFLYGWSSIVLAGVLAAALSNAWWSTAGAILLPPAFMLLDLLFLQVGFYGNVNFRT